MPDFTPTKWASAEDKAKFLVWFKRFVRRGCPESLFHKDKYERLSNMFGNIAHYNKVGFYDHHFSTPAAKASSLLQWSRHQVYGDPAWTWSDVEREMQVFLQANGGEILLRYTQDSDLATREKNLTALRLLVRAYPAEAADILAQYKL